MEAAEAAIVHRAAGEEFLSCSAMHRFPRAGGMRTRGAVEAPTGPVVEAPTVAAVEASSCRSLYSSGTSSHSSSCRGVHGSRGSVSRLCGSAGALEVRDSRGHACSPLGTGRVSRCVWGGVRGGGALEVRNPRGRGNAREVITIIIRRMPSLPIIIMGGAGLEGPGKRPRTSGSRGRS